MRFKTPELQNELDRVPKFLYLIAEEFERISLRYNKDPVITRIFEPVENESGVHLVGRAIDFRDFHDGRLTYLPSEREYLLWYINNKFPRADGRDTLIWHFVPGSVEHFHLQIAALPSAYSGMFLVQDAHSTSLLPA